MKSRQMFSNCLVSLKDSPPLEGGDGGGVISTQGILEGWLQCFSLQNSSGGLIGMNPSPIPSLRGRGVFSLLLLGEESNG